jgi:hypothetical protein
MRNNVRFSLKFLPRIVHMLDRETRIAPAGTEENPNEILSIYLNEEENNLSSPERLILMLSGVQKLYEGCARLTGNTINTISVVACDSGTEKTFDFLGLAKIFEEVRGIITICGTE